MAAYVLNISRIFSREVISASFQFHRYRSCLQRLPAVKPNLLTHQFTSSAACWQEAEVHAAQTADRYKQRPWVYLDSEEYVERYGSSAVWAGYRRNHKGGIPPQKTRKTCIRGDKICGNPCPICRDPNIIINHQNVKLLQQFISPHTGMVYDPTLTGVCMKQQKKLNEAINKARDDGLLPFQIPHVDFSGEDYSNTHDAVGLTSPPPFLSPSEPWYKWIWILTPGVHVNAKVHVFEESLLTLVAKVNTCIQYKLVTQISTDMTCKYT
uniref:Small ribosomal subunit protein mS40 n=1 Tax=Poecilia reticulata TaxID=8081 RepID=A0A3P9P872_POERE